MVAELKNLIIIANINGVRFNVKSHSFYVSVKILQNVSEIAPSNESILRLGVTYCVK